MNLNIIENFYSAEDFKHMATMALMSQYQAAWQPRNKFYMSRSHGYPCFESWFLENGKNKVRTIVQENIVLFLLLYLLVPFCFPLIF